MPIDTSMYQNIQQPANPLAMAGQVMGLRNVMTQNQILQKTMGAQQATGEAVQGATSPDGTFDPNAFMSTVASDPRAAYGAQQAAEFAQQQKMQQLAAAHQQLGVLQQNVGALLQNPNVTKDDVTSQIGKLVGMKVITPQAAAAEITDLQGVPDGQLPLWLRGHEMAMMQGQQQIEAMLGPQVPIDNGSQIVPTRMPLVPGTSMPAAPNAAPIDKTLTPEGAASPVAGPVNPDGSPTTIPLGQRATMGKLTTGQSPAAAAAATTSGAGTAQDAIAFENGARQLPAMRAALQNLDGDIAQLQTGPGASQRASWVARINSLFGTSLDASDVATTEGVDKIHSEIAARQRQTLGLPTTDQSSSIMDHATPGSNLSKLGNQNMSALLRGNVDYAQTANQAWEHYKASGHGTETFHQFTTALNSKLDPLVFQMQYMSGTQKQGLVGAMDSAEQNRLAQSLAFARHNGLVH